MYISRLKSSSLSNPRRSLFSLLALFWMTMAASGTSASLQLNFTVPSSFNESNRQALLQWNAEPARTYLVQSTTNLAPGAEWKNEEPVRATSAGPIQWTAPDFLGTQKYFRLLLPQPEVFSVEPAFVDSADPGALFYLIGQLLPTNGSVRINGQNFNVLSSDPDGSWIGLSLNGLPPGTPVIGTLQVLDQGSNVVATLPLQNPVLYGTEMTAEQVQGPAEEPVARPESHIVEEIEFIVEKVERARTARPGDLTVFPAQWDPKLGIHVT